jgi:thymidylate synthase (FAD)
VLIEYIDSMGDDLAVVNAARVSFDKESEWHYSGVDTNGPLEKRLHTKDQKLISFLARGCTSGDWEKLVDEMDEWALEGDYQGVYSVLHHIRKMPSHWSPFAHTAIKVRMKMPIFVARQIMKHTTGIEYNEVSRRYVDSEPEFYVPDVWRKKADNVKQGSSEKVVQCEGTVRHEYLAVCNDAVNTYKIFLEDGVAPEQARMILPQSMYTEVIATGNLYAWANMYNQRTDSHAQKETRDLVIQLGPIMEKLFPVSWKELTE